MTTADAPPGRLRLSAAVMLRSHPPRWQHADQKALFQHVCPPRATHAGEIVVTRRLQRGDRVLMALLQFTGAQPVSGSRARPSRRRRRTR